MSVSRRTSTAYSTASTRRTTSRRTNTDQRSLTGRYFRDGPTDYTFTPSRPRTARQSTGRPGTARPRTGVSTLGAENQEIICAVSEGRGISPTIGLAFVNLDTGEAVLSQISDSQTYVRTVHKLTVFNPSSILIVSTAQQPKSKLFSIVEDSLEDIGSNLILLDRRYWAETTGVEYIQQLAFAEELESIKTAISGNYYAVCCFAAALKYIELGLSKTFPLRSLRIKYEPPEGSMMIDLATIRSLELVQNLQNPKSKDCLFGLVNETLTPMGGRLLRSNVLQPLTDPGTLSIRLDAVEELSTKEEMFFAARQALKPFLDVDKTLTQLILVPTQPTLTDTEQAINNVIMLKQFIGQVKPVFEAVTGARCSMLQDIHSLCALENVEPVQDLIDSVINEDTAHVTQPLDLRNQRTYAVKSGVNGLLDVARQTYKEGMTDALEHISALKDEHDLPLQTKFDNVRQFYLRLSASDLEHQNLPEVFINVFRKKDKIECQTLHLMKLNQKISSAHTEVLMMSDKAVQTLVSDVRANMSVLFKICEGIGMLDMLCAFAQVVTSKDYVRPQFGDTLAVQSARHPIREKIHTTKFVPNDVYATQQSRFQIITGCNMSGKSTYIRTIALLTVMAQFGSFVPAQYAMLPITRQLFARISVDDSLEANVSTFAAEMRETAFILSNIDRHSLAIVDELGRGTSTRDGLAIAIAIAEALVESRALVWFATHFRDLARIMSERAGVVSYHLAVDTHEDNKMAMLYRLSNGAEEESHYGLKLARIVPLPRDVVEHAEHVARTLEQQGQKKKKGSIVLVQARRRKVLLNLKEHLLQARNGAMGDEELKVWLEELQREFVRVMVGLDREMEEAERGDDGNENEEEEQAGSKRVDGEHDAPLGRPSAELGLDSNSRFTAGTDHASATVTSDD